MSAPRSGRLRGDFLLPPDFYHASDQSSALGALRGRPHAGQIRWGPMPALCIIPLGCAAISPHAFQHMARALVLRALLNRRCLLFQPVASIVELGSWTLCGHVLFVDP